MPLNCLLLASIASTAALASSQSASSNASAARTFAPSNSSRASHTEDMVCVKPPFSVPYWWYNTRDNGPYFMYGEWTVWTMLSAYRRGGTENVHWKYTDNDYDEECLNGWDLYSEDGETLIDNINGRTTKLNSKRKWCALPVYRSGGVQGNQWEYCSCWDAARKQ